MRILMINKFLYRRGGAETYMLDLAAELETHGHTIEYFGMEDEQNIVGNSLGLGTRNVDFHQKSLKNLTYPATIIYSREARDKIRQVIQEFKPDIAHLNNINFQITPVIIDVLYEEGIPIVMTAHDFQLICPNHLLYIPQDREICVKCTDMLSLDCISRKCIHESLPKSIIGYMEAALYRNRDTYNRIDCLICPSRFMKRALDKQERFNGKTVFLRNFSRNYPEKQVEKEDYILYFGRFYEEKGLRQLTEAMQGLPDIPMIAAGSGPLEPIFEQAPNITCVGYKNGEELEDLIRKARFSVYPSSWYENCPLSIIESQKLGTPCLATGIGGMKELVGSENVIHGTSPESIREAIRSLWDDRERLSVMEAELGERIASYPNIVDYAKKIEEIYCHVQSNYRNHSA